MARLAIESQAAPAAQGPLEVELQNLATLALVVAGVTLLSQPGIAAGAAVAGVWQLLHRPSVPARLAWALAAAAPLLILHPFLEWAWPLRDWLASAWPDAASSVDGRLALRSIYTEALLGPLWLEAVVLGAQFKRRTVQAQLRRDHRLDRRRWRAISGERQPVALSGHRSLRVDASSSHPAGRVRLGSDAETNAPLDLELPDDLASHVFLPGATGSGKTTTLLRLADGALGSGYGVVIVDAKAGGLGVAARQLADRHGVRFYIVDPESPDSLGYNPCAGDDASVANKLVGAFTYSQSAEIYKNIAMEAVPVVVRALHAADQPVTLQALYDAFGVRGMANIAHKLPEDSRDRERLLELDARDDDRTGGRDRTGKAGKAGLQYRLGALLEGKFGQLFRSTEPLDWDQALADPSVTYIALSTLASSEDVELMGRVIAQDLKQVCARRIRQLGEGASLAPVLCIFDEFAALEEADQLIALLLQARQGLMPTVISTQYLPETTALRKACLSAGLLIVHRVEAEDAEAIAAQFGTRRATEVTHQVDYATGFSEKGTIRRVDKYNVHPNELRNFSVGQAALKSIPKGRYTIVQIYLD